MQKILISLSSNFALSCISWFLFVLFFLPTIAYTACVSDISDIPLQSRLTPAPANIMFILDNSGSMDLEFITPEKDGSYRNKYYLYPDSAYINGNDRFYPDGNELDHMQKREWQSQWHIYNKLFYNPNIHYAPWPQMSHASKSYPLSNPANNSADDSKFNMTGEYFKLPFQYLVGDDSEYGLVNPDISGESAYSAVYKVDDMISIKNAHYFMLNDLNKNGRKDAGEDIYLINFVDKDGDNIPDTRDYYRFNDINSDNRIDTGELIYEVLVPDRVKAGIYDDQGNFIRFATTAEDIQNFANWFSFYRKRELVSKSAVAVTINNMEGVNIGFYSINQGARQTVLAVKVQNENGITDNTDRLLDLLYKMDLESGTPLRTALKSVGQYYHTHDNQTGGLGESPYAAPENGGACQQAFAIIMTDGFWNGPSPEVGNQDADTASPYDGPPYADNYSETLADVAMKYYKEDLAPSLDNMVPTNSCDRANHQHMVTHCISLGLSGTLNPNDYHSCLLDGNIPNWPAPEAGDAQKIDDLWHAAINGRGLFFSVSEPQELVSSLRTITSPISSKRSSGGSVAIKAGQLSTETALYQSTYMPDEWTGDLFAYPINLSTVEINQSESAIIWQASERLESTDWENRNIVTYDPELRQGIIFSYEFLNNRQKAELNFDVNITDYIKGKKIPGFRDRTVKLGDIVRSSPVLKDNTIFIGANDGMLHALDTKTGDERFAYIPDAVLKNFHNSSMPEKSFYKDSYEHRFFVDATPFIRDNIDPDNDGKDKKYTFLVGGLGKGGKAYYCLDITSADTISKDSSYMDIDKVRQMVKWEYPAEQDNDLGYTYSTPVIVKSNAPGKEDPKKKKWIVIFGNGYESENGNAVLYILDMDGTLLKKIDTRTGNCNGLSSPAVVDVDSDMVADYVYAGDLKGNLWKFDIRDSNPANWDIAFKDSMGNPAPMFSVPEKPITTKPEVMFHCGADMGADCSQQNFAGYMVFFGTGKYIADQDRFLTEPQYLFGIWDYGHDDDDSAYIGQFSEGGYRQLSNIHSDIQLKEQTVVFSDYRAGKYVRVLSDNSLNWAMTCINLTNSYPKSGLSESANAGWYFKLPLAGERIISDLILRDGKLLFTSFIPDISPCSGGGNSIIHIIDACTGGRLKVPFWDINNDRKIDANDLIDFGVKDENGNPVPLAPSGMEMTGLLHKPVLIPMSDNSAEIQIFSGSAGNIETILKTKEPTGIFYWRLW